MYKEDELTFGHGWRGTMVTLYINQPPPVLLHVWQESITACGQVAFKMAEARNVYHSCRLIIAIGSTARTRWKATTFEAADRTETSYWTLR